MIRNTPTSDGSNSVANNIAAFLVAVSTVIVASFGVIYTTPFISTQFTNPIIEGGIGTIISIGLLTLGVVVGLLFTAVVMLGIINSYAEPRIFGYNEYQVFGIAGIIGVITAVIYYSAITVPVIAAYLPETPDRSLVAMTVLAVPLALMFHRVSLDSSTTGTTTPASPARPANTQPEVPKAGPVDWDRDPPETRHPSNAAKQTNTRQQTTDKQEEKSTGTSNESTTDEDTDEFNTPQDDTVDYSNLEFQWRTETDVSFSDVGGMSDTKQELRRDIIKPLTTGKEKANAFGIPVPNLLFHGPPGTGKTFMAKALATELGLPFAKLSGADIQTKWINQSAQKVNQLFTEAKQVAAKEGGAVVFIDELDSVLRDRDDATNAHAEDQKVVNEFLNQLQDLDDYDIVFIGATNRPDILDKAGTRSGRIDKKIEIGLPDEDARRGIIEAQLDDKPHTLDDAGIDTFVQRTDGLVAADIHSVVMDAARESAFGRDADVIQWQDIEAALDS